MWNKFTNTIREAAEIRGTPSREEVTSSVGRNDSIANSSEQQQQQHHRSEEGEEVDILDMLAKEEEELRQEDEDIFGLHNSSIPEMTTTTNEAPALLDEVDEDYVPESLADFVREANATLEQTQQHFMEKTEQRSQLNMSWESTESPTHIMREDEQDRKLKGQILSSLAKHEEQGTASPLQPARSTEDPPTGRLAVAPAYWSPQQGQPPPTADAPRTSNNTEITPQLDNTTTTTTKNRKQLPAAGSETPFWSPDLMTSPPPNPVAAMTDSEIKREATGVSAGTTDLLHLWDQSGPGIEQAQQGGRISPQLEAAPLAHMELKENSMAVPSMATLATVQQENVPWQQQELPTSKDCPSEATDRPNQLPGTELSCEDIEEEKREGTLVSPHLVDILQMNEPEVELSFDEQPDGKVAPTCHPTPALMADNIQMEEPETEIDFDAPALHQMEQEPDQVVTQVVTQLGDTIRMDEPEVEVAFDSPRRPDAGHAPDHPTMTHLAYTLQNEPEMEIDFDVPVDQEGAQELDHPDAMTRFANTMRTEEPEMELAFEAPELTVETNTVDVPSLEVSDQAVKPGPRTPALSKVTHIGEIVETGTPSPLSMHSPTKQTPSAKPSPPDQAIAATQRTPPLSQATSANRKSTTPASRTSTPAMGSGPTKKKKKTSSLSSVSSRLMRRTSASQTRRREAQKFGGTPPSTTASGVTSSRSTPEVRKTPPIRKTSPASNSSNRSVRHTSASSRKSVKTKRASPRDLMRGTAASSAKVASSTGSRNVGSSVRSTSTQGTAARLSRSVGKATPPSEGLRSSLSASPSRLFQSTAASQSQRVSKTSNPSASNTSKSRPTTTTQSGSTHVTPTARSSASRLMQSTAASQSRSVSRALKPSTHDGASPSRLVKTTAVSQAQTLSKSATPSLAAAAAAAAAVNHTSSNQPGPSQEEASSATKNSGPLVSPRLLSGTAASHSREKARTELPTAAVLSTISPSLSTQAAPLNPYRTSPPVSPRLLRETVASHSRNAGRAASPSAQTHCGAVPSFPALPVPRDLIPPVSPRLTQDTAASQSRKAASTSAPLMPAPGKDGNHSHRNVATQLAESPDGSASPILPRFIRDSTASQLQSETGTRREASLTAGVKTPETASGGTPQQASSRLMQGTAASRAHTVNRVARGTAATRSHSVTVSEGQAKAKERLRQRKAQEGRPDLHQKHARVANTRKHHSSPVSQKGALSSARERVRRRKLEEEAAIAKRKARQPVVGALSSKPSAGSRLTSSTRKRESSVPKGKNEPTLAQSADFLRKGLRDEAAPTQPRNGPSLTVPRAPQFATTARHGEPMLSRSASSSPVPLARSTDVLRQGLRGSRRSLLGPQAPTRKAKQKPTIPHAPHFATTDRHGEKERTPGVTGSATLAQSTEVLCKGLRHTEPSTRRDARLTIPQTPRFHSASKRELPQSEAEKEKELMDYYKAHPFKARPVMTSHAPRSAHSVVRKPAKRRLTMPAPFHFHTDARVATAKPPVKPHISKTPDVQEMKTEFHARPMPSFSQPSKSQSARMIDSRKKVVTVPVPFHFSKSKTRIEPKGPDEKELSKQFHARPLPSTTFKPSVMSPCQQLRSPASSVSSSNPPSLATSSRVKRRSAAAMASRRKAERLAQLREQDQRNRQRERHNEAMKMAEISSPVSRNSIQNAEPFDLASGKRHEHYQKQLEEKLQHEEAERLQQMSFHARSFHQSKPPPQKIRSDRGATQPAPFHLPGQRRHELYQEEQRRKASEMEEEQKKQAAFRAKPVPRSTYEYKPPPPKEKGPLADPFSPALQSKQRAVERQAFDASAEAGRAAEEARKRALQEQLEAEEEEDLQERLRLPVSEGGMIPTAEPVNAVFYKQAVTESPATYQF